MFQAITRSKAIWMLRVLTLRQLCKAQYFASAFALRVMRAYKGDGNSASRKKWKELSSSKISTEGSFNGDSNEETLNVKKRTCWQ